MMKDGKYVLRESKKARRPRRTEPNQSMSLKEIVTRYMRQMPIDVIQRDRHWLDQDEHDFHKISRMSPTDQVDFAAEQAAKASDYKRELQADAQRRQEEKEASQRPKENEQKAAGGEATAAKA